MERIVSICDAIDGYIRRLAQATGWLFLVAIAIICFDVFTRKFGYQASYFTSTRLQELEWHVTSTLFLTWLAYGIVKDTHVRIDVFTGHLPQAKKDRIDFWGCVVFAMPYCLIVFPYCFLYFLTSYHNNESSDAPNGLPARYIIKGIMALGLFNVLLASVSMMLRKYVDIWGPPSMHSKREQRLGAPAGVEL